MEQKIEQMRSNIIGNWECKSQGIELCITKLEMNIKFNDNIPQYFERWPEMESYSKAGFMAIGGFNSPYEVASCDGNNLILVEYKNRDRIVHGQDLKVYEFTKKK